VSALCLAFALMLQPYPPKFDEAKARADAIDPARQWSAEAWDQNGVMIGVIWSESKTHQTVMRFDGTFFSRPIPKGKK
jgi:hypothetical protein